MAQLDVVVVEVGARSASGNLDRLTSSARGAENRVASLESQVRSSRSAFSSLNSVVVGLMSAIGVGELIKYSDAWQTLSNKLANARKDGESLADVQARVLAISQNSRTSVEATAQLYGRLEPATRALISSGSDLGSVIETINKAMIVSGATSEEANGALVQLSQALGAGALRGEEFNSINEQGPRIMQALADSLGVARGELKNMAAQGKLTSEVVINAMTSQRDVIDKEFSNLSATFGQRMTEAGNNITKAIGGDSDASRAVSSLGAVVVSASENIDGIVAVGGALATLFAGRLAGSATSSAAAIYNNAKASAAAANATKAEADAALIAANIKVRKLTVDKSEAQILLAVAEAEAVAARGTNAEAIALQNLAAIKTASIEVSIAYSEAVTAQAAAQSAAAAAAKSASVAMTGLNSTLSLVGGPTGMIIIAAASFMYLSSKSDEAKQKNEEFAKSIDTTSDSLRKMTPIALEAARAKLELTIQSQTEEMSNQADIVNSLTGELDQYKRESEAVGLVAGGLKDKEGELAIERGKLEEITSKLTESKSKLSSVTQALTGNITANYVELSNESKQVGIAIGMQNELNRVLGVQVATRSALSNYVETSKPSYTDKEKEYLSHLENESALLRLNGKERAAQEAYYAAKEKGFSDTVASIAASKATENYQYSEGIKAREKAADAAESAAKKEKAANDAIEAKISDATLKTQQLKQERENLTRGTDQIIAGTSRYSQATAELAAKQALGTTATQDQIDRLAEQLLTQDKVTESIEKMKKAQEDKKDLSKLTSDFQKDAYDSGNATDLERQEEYHQQRLQQIQDHNNTEYAASVEGQKMINDAKLAEDVRYNNQRSQLQQQSMLNTMNSIQTSAGIMTSALKSAGKENTAAYRILFAAEKAAAIPSMILATEKAFTETLAMGGAFAIPMATAVKAMGYASIGVVAAQAVAGRAQGGQVIAGQTYNVGERGMETFTPSQNGWITPNGGNTNNISATNNVYNYAGVNVKTTPNESGGTDTYITRDEFADLMAVHGADPNSKFNRSRGTVYRQQRA